MIPAVTFGFILGIAIGSLFHINFWTFIAGGVLGLVCFGYKYFISEKDQKVLLVASLFIFGILFGVGRVSISNLYSNSDLTNFVGQKIEAVGVVVAEPDVREHNTKLTVALEKVGDTSVNEKILISVPIYPEYNYGDKLKLSLTLEEPKNIESEDGRIFDYKGYLRVRGIWYTSRFSRVELLSSGNGNTVKSLLFKTKKLFTTSIDNAMPQPESSLLAGLLLGTKQSLGKDLLLEFQKTGVSHIVVLSGYNIAIVAKSVMSFLKFLPSGVSFGVGAVSVVLFTMLSGGGASAVRASIMVLVALFAKQFNRDYKANRVLGFTVILMLAPNPLLLVFDPSFQLSVLATIGIIFVTPIMEPYFKWVTEKFGLREVVSSTVATQLTVLPFLIYNTGLLSIVSLPVNVLILGTIPLTMFLGFVTGLVGLLSLYLSFIPALFTYGLLWYQLKVVEIGSSIPLGSILLPSFSPIFLVIIYLVIFICLYYLNKKSAHPLKRAPKAYRI